MLTNDQLWLSFRPTTN